MLAAGEYRELGEAAWAWVARQVQDDAGPWLPEEVPLQAADQLDDGLDWRMFPGHRSSTPNYSHGTAGVASALGAAGIAAFLLRIARVAEHGLSALVVDRPDQWWAVPAQLRVVSAAGRHRPGPGSG